MRALIIDKSALKHNITEIKKKAEGVGITANLSCGGQGIGAVKLAFVLREEGINSFAVSEVSDAVALRQNGFTEEQITMLRPTTDHSDLVTLVEHNVICTVGSYDTGMALHGIAKEKGAAVEVKIAVDTGLGYYGFQTGETDKIINLYKHLDGLCIVGMCTSLSVSWKNKKTSESQLGAFSALVDRLHEAGCETGPVCALDSAALFKYNFDKMDELCIGSAIIGEIPGRGTYGLKKVSFIEADVEEIDWIPKGSRIGCGASYKLKVNSKIGTIGVGLCNGIGGMSGAESRGFAFKRILSLFTSRQGFAAPQIKVNGTKVKTAGPAGLTDSSIDLTKIECAPGDKAIIEADPRFINGLPVIIRQ